MTDTKQTLLPDEIWVHGYAVAHGGYWRDMPSISAVKYTRAATAPSDKDATCHLCGRKCSEFSSDPRCQAVNLLMGEPGKMVPVCTGCIYGALKGPSEKAKAEALDYLQTRNFAVSQAGETKIYPIKDILPDHIFQTIRATLSTQAPTEHPASLSVEAQTASMKRHAAPGDGQDGGTLSRAPVGMLKKDEKFNTVSESVKPDNIEYRDTSGTVPVAGCSDIHPSLSLQAEPEGTPERKNDYADNLGYAWTWINAKIQSAVVHKRPVLDMWLVTRSVLEDAMEIANKRTGKESLQVERPLK